MKIKELVQTLKAFLELEGFMIEPDAMDRPVFAALDTSTGFVFVFNIPGHDEVETGRYGVELHVTLPLLAWRAVRPASRDTVLKLLACCDTLPCSVNSLGFQPDRAGEPARIVLQGSTGLQRMETDDENDIRLLLESMVLDAADAMVPLQPHVTAAVRSQS